MRKRRNKAELEDEVSEDKDAAGVGNSHVPGSNSMSSSSSRGVHPVRRLIIFQLKLALDALRDFALSPVALFATIADMILNKTGKQSYFAKLMRFGRQTDMHINLFEHHQKKNRTLDGLVEQVEELVVKEYQDGELSAKAKMAIENSLKMKKRSNKTSNF